MWVWVILIILALAIIATTIIRTAEIKANKELIMSGKVQTMSAFDYLKSQYQPSLE